MAKITKKNRGSDLIMTKEQEEAIGKLEHVNRYYDCNNYYSRYELDCIETVLNMLKEKDKEIEHQIEKRNNQKAALAILNEKQKEMNKLINTVKSYKGQMKKETKRIKKLEKEAQKYFEENIKKDKIIDFMSEKLAKTYHYKANKCKLKEKEQNNINCDKYKDCASCVKQYFKSKAEKE